jgi:hypothetical protein
VLLIVRIHKTWSFTHRCENGLCPVNIEILLNSYFYKINCVLIFEYTTSSIVFLLERIPDQKEMLECLYPSTPNSVVFILSFSSTLPRIWLSP